MKLFYSAAIILATSLIVSCSSVKPTYFTSRARTKIETDGVTLTQLQYFIDRDIELRREVSREEANVSKGNVKIIGGKYIDIVALKKGTPGVCVGQYPDKILVSFETGSNKFLTFGKTKFSTEKDPYKILAFDWYSNGDGYIKYDGKNYHITKGGDAGIKIKAQYVRESDKVKQRNMQGVKVDN